MKTLDDLEELLAAATPGEWVVKRPTFGTGVFVAPSGAQSARCAIAKITHVDEDVERANAELITMMHNALPALIAAARALDDLVGPGAYNEYVCQEEEHDESSDCIYCAARSALEALGNRTLSQGNAE